ncbi:response regulator [Sphingomonas mollis]
MNGRPQEITVLVVEDEPMLRLLAVDMVEDAGFTALEAANSTEAVRILETRRDIQIVFTDVNMPQGIDGLDLATCIRDRWPWIEIIITSGKPFPINTPLPARSVFYTKPYRQAQIIDQIKRMAA